MGGGPSYSFAAQNARSIQLQSKSKEQIFSKKLKEQYDPSKITFRESRDINGKEAMPISIYFDVTGSMGDIPDRLIKYDMNDLVKHIQSCGLFELPQICFGAISDGITDDSCIQVTQFESNELMASHLENIWLECRGGGNGRESYHMPWLFNLDRVLTDEWEKRGRKGFLFTIGDEPFGQSIHSNELEFLSSNYKRYPRSEYQNKSVEMLFAEASEKWEIFHLHIDHGHYDTRDVIQTAPYLKNRLITVPSDVSLDKIIVSAMMFARGISAEQIRTHFTEMGEEHFANTYFNVIFKNIIKLTSGE